MDKKITNENFDNVCQKWKVLNESMLAQRPLLWQLLLMLIHYDSYVHLKMGK